MRSANTNESTATTALMRFNFSTTSAFFNTGNTQLDFYGGYQESFPNAALGGIVTGAPGLATGGFGGFFGQTGASTSNTPYAITTFALWQKPNFMNGGDLAGVSFDATSALNVNGGDFSYPTGLRFVIRNGSTYYVSEALLRNQWAPNIGSLSDFNNNSTVGKRWAEWAPTDTSFGVPSPGTFAAVDFNNVTAVGIVQEAGRNEYHGTFRLVSFSVDNAVVPEPAALALLGLAGLLAVRRRIA